MRDDELGAYLRGRREATAPSDVGLPAGTRRRTPGLRRSELATLAGISVEYLTRIEQGRDRNPSSQVLSALADALRLPTSERVHLRTLSKMAGGGFVLCTMDEPSRTVRPTVRALLDRFEPTPAVVVNRLREALAYTSGYARLAGPVGLLDGRPPSLLRFLFSDPRARAVFPDWERLADDQVTALRVDSTCTDPHVQGLVEDLIVLAGAAFTDRLEARAKPVRRTGVERWVHPEAGELRLAYETLELSDADDQRLIAYLPADEATSAGLDRLTGRRPGALRAVTG